MTYRRFDTATAPVGSPFHWFGWRRWRFQFTIGPGDQCWYTIKVREPLSRRTTIIKGRFTHSLTMHIEWAFDQDNPARALPAIRYFMGDVVVRGESAADVWERVADKVKRAA